ncbi:B-cell receptor CD22-like [Centropristis striata]|uniref:B-cell receptor CD22-like n=1 Tax=Centropristis striata TaxID=184440 RepID=UPI0027DEC6BE|nr:B-cell receptor CD22-like [Centropristis striata]
MSCKVAAAGFVVFLLSLSVVQSQNGWGVTYTSTEICAPTGSTVEMSCTYTYPSMQNPSTKVNKAFWYTKINLSEPVDLRTDSEYKDRVQSSCSNNICTLRISDLRKSDADVYKFKFVTIAPDGKYTGEPGVTLSVTDLKVQRYKSTHSDWLQCDSSCLPAYRYPFVWYQNGQEIQKQNSYYLSDFDNQHSYSCALKGYVDFPSPSVCVDGTDCNRLTYTDKRICASKGSSVKISCTYNKYNYGDASTFWFRKSPLRPKDLVVNSQYAGRAEVETVRGRSTLTISELTESDSAEYHFKFKTPSSEWSSSPGTTLTVTELQVQVIRVYQSFTELKCHSSCSPAGRSSFIWFKNGEKFREGETFYYSGRLNSTEDISCALKGHEEFPSPPVYAPRLPSVSVSPSAEIVEGSSVTLTCSSDANPAANITWYKENEDSAKASGQIFTITDFRAEHSGNYYCEAQNKFGHENATICLTLATGKPPIAIIITIVALLVLVLILIAVLLCRWIRKKKTLDTTSEPNDPVKFGSGLEYQSVKTAAKTEDKEEQEDLM